MRLDMSVFFCKKMGGRGPALVPMETGEGRDIVVTMGSWGGETISIIFQ